MIWRIIVWSWVLALLAGMIVYFSNDLFVMLNLRAEQGLNVLNWSELLATLLAIVGTLGLCTQLFLEYVLAPKDQEQ